MGTNRRADACRCSSCGNKHAGKFSRFGIRTIDTSWCQLWSLGLQRLFGTFSISFLDPHFSRGRVLQMALAATCRTSSWTTDTLLRCTTPVVTAPHLAVTVQGVVGTALNLVSFDSPVRFFNSVRNRSSVCVVTDPNEVVNAPAGAHNHQRELAHFRRQHVFGDRTQLWHLRQ